ncbi:hypothetical protein GGX14DRAFT_404875 [Mycena pura]|uniref:Uncharacterized protein n=1 Tax=Mycena pura TaxID=153505 RepID=A0AAD6Y4X0_9AGAR|nr:hypothetical protein GGX14DRAFT_404875 [Mycena pura]
MYYFHAPFKDSCALSLVPGLCISRPVRQPLWGGTIASDKKLDGEASCGAGTSSRTGNLNIECWRPSCSLSAALLYFCLRLLMTTRATPQVADLTPNNDTVTEDDSRQLAAPNPRQPHISMQKARDEIKVKSHFVMALGMLYSHKFAFLPTGFLADLNNEKVVENSGTCGEPPGVPRPFPFLLIAVEELMSIGLNGLNAASQCPLQLHWSSCRT